MRAPDAGTDWARAKAGNVGNLLTATTRATDVGTVADRELTELLSAIGCSSHADRESGSIAILIAMNLFDASGSIDLRCCAKSEWPSVVELADGQLGGDHERGSKSSIDLVCDSQI